MTLKELTIFLAEFPEIKFEKKNGYWYGTINDEDQVFLRYDLNAVICATSISFQLNSSFSEKFTYKESKYFSNFKELRENIKDLFYMREECNLLDKKVKQYFRMKKIGEDFQ